MGDAAVLRRDTHAGHCKCPKDMAVTAGEGLLRPAQTASTHLHPPRAVVDVPLTLFVHQSSVRAVTQTGKQLHSNGARVTAVSTLPAMSRE